jgi:hypothetical protein
MSSFFLSPHLLHRRLSQQTSQLSVPTLLRLRPFFWTHPRAPSSSDVCLSARKLVCRSGAKYGHHEVCWTSSLPIYVLSASFKTHYLDPTRLQDPRLQVLKVKLVKTSMMYRNAHTCAFSSHVPRLSWVLTLALSTAHHPLWTNRYPLLHAQSAAVFCC